jgi:DNA-binding SARP family transcriptional activator
MSHLLQAQLLGRYSVQLDHQPVGSIHVPRLQVLFAYLLLHHDTPMLRSNLAYKLWPDSNETQARTNLRNLLHLLRQALLDCDTYLHIDNQLIQWLPDVEFDLDVECFESELNQANRFESQEDLNRCRVSLENAVALYKGELLPDHYAEWIIVERERVSQAYMQALERLIGLLENQRSYHKAIFFVLDLLRFDPLQESAYRQLMRLHLITGNRGEAIAVYNTCAAVLQRELLVRPSPVTDELYHRILKTGGQPLSLLSGAEPASPFSVPDPLRGTRRGKGGSESSGQPPLIGRQPEWEKLQTAWQKACAGEPCFFLLAGDTGLGKTYLSNELFQWARRLGFSAAYAHGQTDGSSLDYAPVAEWLGELKLPVLDTLYQSEIARLLPNILTQNPTVPHPQPLVESWQRQRLLEALARALLGVDLPLLLVLDDMQGCDDKTLEFLRFMLVANPHAPLMILATIPSIEYSQTSNLTSYVKHLAQVVRVVEHELTPFEKIQTTALAEMLYEKAIDPSQADVLFEETEGNPMMITELVRARLEDGDPLQTGGSTTRNAPPTLPLAIRQAFEERLAYLSSPAYNLAGFAAAIGLKFSHQTLQIASGLEDGPLVDALDELFQRRILRDEPNGTYRFSHNKLREVVYSSMSTARRNWYLRRIAAMVDSGT